MLLGLRVRESLVWFEIGSALVKVKVLRDNGIGLGHLGLALVFMLVKGVIYH